VLREIRIHGCADTEEALALQEPIARLLCPDPGHAPPCEIPWSFTVDGECLVLGVIASAERAAEVADRVRALVGDTRPVAVRAGDAERFEDLVEQHRIESGSR
jgi:hypothetical protein